jgi:hypothetical protein
VQRLVRLGHDVLDQPLVAAADHVQPRAVDDDLLVLRVLQEGREVAHPEQPIEQPALDALRVGEAARALHRRPPAEGGDQVVDHAGDGGRHLRPGPQELLAVEAARQRAVDLVPQQALGGLVGRRGERRVGVLERDARAGQIMQDHGGYPFRPHGSRTRLRQAHLDRAGGRS